MSRVLIATPQPEELDPMLETWQQFGHPATRRRVGELQCHEVPSLNLIAAVAGHGKAQFAVQTQHLVDRMDDARCLVCLGAAGSLVEEAERGDLVVGSSTVEHDYRLRFVEADLPEHTASEAMVRQMRGVARSRSFPFDVHVGRIASGDEDVIDPERASEIRAATGALCVAWEGAGGARVADFNGLDFLEIRGVTDAADAGAPLSFGENVSRAMTNAARLLLRWRGERRER